VSSLALMRWLEGAPARYDAGMRWLTLGRAARVHAALAECAGEGARVLEIGCGTGALTERLVARGARVAALDQNPEMLDLARARLAAVPGAEVAWHERTAAEIDALPVGGFDAVVSAFALSEMSHDERAYVLRAARERLAAGGVLAVGDEVRPRGRFARALLAVLRAPQAAVAWLVAGSVSHPIADLPGELGAAGFVLREERRYLLGSLGVFRAEVAP